MNQDYKVYVHIFPNGKRYVGITGQKVERRWRKGLGYSANVRLTRAFKKYGWDSVRHEILLTGLSLEEAAEAEKNLIAEWDLLNENVGYNLAPGGICSVHTEETKKKIGAASKGRKHSNEFKSWISEKNRGENNYMYGRTHSEETKHKISEAKKGKGIKPNEGKFGGDHPAAKSIAAINIDTGNVEMTFRSIVEASKQMGVCKSCLQAALHGKQRTSCGYRWEYVGQ